MLSLAIFLPLLGALAVLMVPARSLPLIRVVAVAVAGLTFLLWIMLWLAFESGAGYQFVYQIPWIEALGVSYAVGVDGLSLPLTLLTALLFLAALVFSWEETDRAKEYYAWFLFLETACLGVFSALDLFLFYILRDVRLFRRSGPQTGGLTDRFAGS